MNILTSITLKKMKFVLLNLLVALCLVTLEPGVEAWSLGSPNDLINLPIQLLFGFPETVALEVVDQLCTFLIDRGFIHPLITPTTSELAIQLRTPCGNTEIPLEEIEELLDLKSFDISKNLVIYVSGWLTTLADPETAAVAKAYLCRDDTNFLVLDNAKFIRTLYSWSSLNTEEIGKSLGYALSQLVRRGYPPEKIHLIGHSLGAQIVGYAGRFFQEFSGKPVARITGLDPANPCFNEGHDLTGIQRGDATFVIIIHTNAGVFGNKEPLGHVDFYVSGLNPIQQGCFFLGCSHLRAPLYYAESVSFENDFLAVPCKSWDDLRFGNCKGDAIPMGYKTPPNARGLYFLNTNAHAPYGKNSSNRSHLSRMECNTCQM